MSVKISPSIATAEGATGCPPSGCTDGCDARPTCQSWRKMRPPAWCTASVTRRQPATCASLWMPSARLVSVSRYSASAAWLV